MKKKQNTIAPAFSTWVLVATYALTYATYALLMFNLCFDEAHEANW